ncbi:hypothetical protein PGB90_009837 [Kerria lacca]
MECGYSKRAQNPSENVNFISSLFLWWTFKEIKKGQKKQFEVEDLSAPLRKDDAHNLGNKMEKLWLEEIKSSKMQGRKASLLNTIFKTFWKEYFYTSVLHAFNTIIGVGSQMSMAYFLMCLKKTNMGKESIENLLYAGLILLIIFGVDNVGRTQFLISSLHLGCRIKVALSSLLYRKCLRLENNCSGNASAGLVVNLMSNDLRQFDDVIGYTNYFWGGIANAILIFLVTTYLVGFYPAIALIVTIFFAMPLQTLLSKSMARNRFRTAIASDKRIQVMDEIICGIHIIKMYAWEKSYEKLIKIYRKIEMKLIRKNLYLRGFQIGISIGLSKCSMYSLVMVYALLDGEVLPEKIFPIMGYCGLLAKVVCGQAFRSTAECSQCYVSIKRIQNFLELKEFEKPTGNVSIHTDDSIKFVDVKANWWIDSNKDTLKNINLTIRKGELITIIGQVGSGKSSLLNVILGELQISEGKFETYGTISYSSQSPWIFGGTIRQNILLSENFEKSRYEEVVKVCALSKDFKDLPNGDLTLVGERGSTLSGGQKSRIALARAIYKRADIYLLDDPLSAVDIKISKEIFDKCILGFLKNTTRIFVTHQLQYLTKSDKIVLLREGIIEAKGMFNEIVSSKANYLNTLKKLNEKNENDTNKRYSAQSIKEENDEVEERLYDEPNKKQELQKEENEVTDSNAFIQYLYKGAGIRGILIVLFFYIITQLAFAACDIWLTIWTQYTVMQKMKNSTNIQLPFSEICSPLQFFIVGYSILIICVILFIILRNSFYSYYGQKCAKCIHDNAFQGVIYTDTSFFHNNPSGRILNRFSKDLGIVDINLLMSFFDASTTVLQVVAAFIITASISIWYILPTVIVIILLHVQRKYYLKTSVTLKRLENITKSPVFVHLHSTLQGLSVIRVSSAMDRFVEEFDQHQDLHTSAWYLYNYTSFGYIFGIAAICYSYIIVIVISCVFLKLSGSSIGLALAQCSILLNYIQWSMKQAAEVSNQVTSVDRLVKYSNLPPESQPKDNNVALPNNWPANGKISFENVSLQYNISSTPSIHDVSFTVESQQKIGIVGRTGAGKTSLLTALLRMGFVNGSIKIDDIDTSTVRLKKLRSKISVIPQDPVLFSGTMRKNLDPFEEYEDNDLWEALSQAELKNTLSKTDGSGLEAVVSEGGKNFSVGERQLICLARAILRKNKILVLDEATANVDQQTDNIIQRTIREKFISCTVLTIAHRLNTIMDSDKILVMDSGTAVEYDHPYILLLNQETIFYKLVSKTGQDTVTTLKEIAEKIINNYNRLKIPNIRFVHMEVGYSEKAQNPSEKASFISLLFFWWTFNVIEEGQKKPYDVEHLPSPIQRDNAHNLGNKIEKIGLQILFAYFLICLKSINAEKDNNEKLTCLGFGLITVYGIEYICRNHFLITSSHLSCRIKVAISSLLYRKCLHLESNSSENTSAGHVINLLSNDMRQFDESVANFSYLWGGILSSLLILVAAAHLVGVYPAIVFITTIFLALPFQTLLSKSMARNRFHTANASDRRIQLMDEIICGINVIKMYAWEKCYEKLIQIYRNAEIRLIRKTLYLRGFQNVISINFSKCSLYFLIVVYALMGGKILPEKVFSMTGYCIILTVIVSTQAFRATGECLECYISIKRIQNFLELNEFEKPIENKSTSMDYAVKFVNVTANWSAYLKKNEPILKNVCLTIKKNELIAITGQVGCGKSSLLNVILGELKISEGKFDIRGKVSYYAQNPWIFAGTIRQNILFSENFEKSRYDEVIEVCALNKDLKNFHNGDLTLIGERGTTLSGGQRARITLARTIYRRANIYLLDDPLCAVDASISKEIFNECILGFLKNTTRILVTHQLQYLMNTNKLAILHEGTIEVEGTFDKIISSKSSYLNTLNVLNKKNVRDANTGNSVRNVRERNSEIQEQLYDQANEKKELEIEDNKFTNSNALIQLLQKEIGILGICIVIFLYIITQVAFAGCDVWLAVWSQYTVSREIQNSTQIWIPFSEILSPIQFFISVYTVLIICVILSVILRNLCYTYYAQKYIKRIHNDAFQGVIYANILFFYNNPSGRILNRFSKDLGVTDIFLPLYTFDALMVCLINRVTKSPVYNHVHSTLQGLPIIRVSDATNKLIEEFDRHQDLHTSAWYLYYYTSAGIKYIAIIVSGSTIGLAISQCSILIDYMQFAMKQTTEISNQITSVDRLMKYASLPSEPQPENNNSSANKNWPLDGKITFENVSLRYNTSIVPSIHGVSFTVESQQKIGIVGRTGAGKTSLLAALLRMGYVEGSIKIDDIDTSTVRLEKLRSKISVIPQDPVLFSGTMRKNLDPFDEYSDNELWEALSQAELEKILSKTDGTGLDTIVSEGGKNFSVGERQLISLARAILRKNKILVLDEATANIDLQTDGIIQKAIRETFKFCTVLTIAHRLNTVVDSDKILVMDNGIVVEYDHPYKLLLNQETVFYKLVSKSGQYVVSAIREIVEQNCNERRWTYNVIKKGKKKPYDVEDLPSPIQRDNAHNLGNKIEKLWLEEIALSKEYGRKCLRLKSDSSENTSAGHVINLLSNDLSQFDESVANTNHLWSGIVSSLFILAAAVHLVGLYPAIAFITTIFLALPLQTLISKSMARNRFFTANASSKRIQLMNEILCGIYIIKIYAWEKPFKKLIQIYRNVEIKLVRKNLYLRGLQYAVSTAFSKSALYSLIVVYALTGGQILPEKVFSMVGYCAILNIILGIHAFRATGECLECYISLKRIQNFLELDEFKKPTENKSTSIDYAVKFVDVTARWSINSNRDTLKNIRLTIKKNELTTIIGQVGCGKSSLLNVILGELKISEGKFDIHGKISYYGQNPWIFAGTIRQNILFTENFEKSRYDEVIEACALNTDLKNFHNGDLTLIGERGSTLSGGQRARIALARAVYKRANIYLLDDPLSAVDANISKEIFEKCFLDFLKNTTRILVTHQLQFLLYANKLVFLHEGTIEAEGTFNELMTSKSNYLNTINKSNETNKRNSVQNLSGINSEVEEQWYDHVDKRKELEKEDNELTNSNALIQFLHKGAGIRGIFIILLLFIFTQLAFAGCDVWLAVWTRYTVSQELQNKTEIKLPFSEIVPSLQFFIGIYTILIICGILLVILRNFSYAYYGQKCAKRFHNEVFQGVIYADMSFFHNNPSGRILNRFSKDLGVVDSILPLYFFDTLRGTFEAISTFIITVSVNVWYIIPSIIIIISLGSVRKFFLKTSVVLKRLENITKSPVYNHVHSTLQGLPIIRVSDATNKLIEEFDRHQDLHTSAWYLYYYTSMGYISALCVICYSFIAVIVISVFFFKLSGSAVGLVLSQCSILIDYVQFAMKQATEVSNQITSVDRLMKYASLPSEPQPENNNSSANKNWPLDGKITFENVSLRYNTSIVPSIHGVSFTVESQQKIGIVGRTGAGKTSLLAALLRMGYVEGSIEIDDIDTSTVRLEKLRSKISVIPQDPVLFSGTMRKNLDPFDEYSDNELWEALSQAELKNTLSNVNGTGLDGMVFEGGKNFSVGERQLICLARAILRKNKILVLDEATASVDQHTDSIIQRTIREIFKSCTVLTIAHRLNTVVDSDKILVMDCGVAVEYDHPYVLLLNQETIFHKMVSKTGQYVAATLTEVAKKNYNENRCQNLEEA